MNTKNLTKKQRQKLEEVLGNIQRAKKYLMNENVVGIAVSIDPNKALGNDYIEQERFSHSKR